MAQILVSTGALIGRPNGRNFRLLSSLSKELACDGYEFMMYSTWYDCVNEVVDFLRVGGFNIPVYHCQKNIGESISIGTSEELKSAFERFRINAEMAGKIGTRKMVIHLWDGITSDSNIQSNLNAFKELRDIACSNGQDLLVENVVCNQKTPMEHWQELADKYPDVHFIFDTKMAAFHGQLELLYKPEYEWLTADGHIRHFHVNDYGGGIMDWANLSTLPIGNGHIDFDMFFDFIKKIKYDDTFTIESTAFNSEGYVDVQMLNRQVDYIKKSLVAGD